LECLLLNIAVCVATRWEFQALCKAFPSGHKHGVQGYRCLLHEAGRLKVFVLKTGMGPEKVNRAFHAVLREHRWDLIVSSGFAGALVPASIGTIVISSRVFEWDQGQALECSEHNELPVSHYYAVATQVASEIDDVPLVGPVVMVERIVWEARQKEVIAKQTQALALDMESGTIGRLAEDYGITFLVVRTISDLVEESLAFDFNLFCHKSTWIRGLCQLFRHPQQVWKINRLRKQTCVAEIQLTRFFERFCSRLGECLA